MALYKCCIIIIIIGSRGWTPLDRLTLNLAKCNFDLILIGGRGLVMDYLCANSLAILVSAVLVLTCGQTDRQTAAHDCYTHATTVSVSNDQIL